VNFQKKHTRPNPQKNIKGGILERESAIRMDKLQVICPSCGEAARLGSHRTEEGVAQRFCRKCKANLGK
jgi:large subunit ribosomal protein L24